MMAPWQIWTSYDGDLSGENFLIVSSDFHLRLNVARQVTVLPVTDEPQQLSHRIQITRPGDDERRYWVLTDQPRTVTTILNPTGWTVSDTERADIRRALRFMMDI